MAANEAELIQSLVIVLNEDTDNVFDDLTDNILIKIQISDVTINTGYQKNLEHVMKCQVEWIFSVIHFNSRNMYTNILAVQLREILQNR